MAAPSVRIGCWAGFWGDSEAAALQVLRWGHVDYLVSDHLAEITMALLARARARDPEAGYVIDAVAALTPLLDEIQTRGTRVITNAGGLNPAACARALREAARRAGVELRVAHVEGDDLLPRHRALVDSGASDMFTGEPLPDDVMTMNAYLGATPIAAALRAGADIVVTGRCVDSAVVLGALMHAFDWATSDFDLLSAGSLVGHILECGPQATGGLSTDWQDVPGWEDIGYPIADCFADGQAVISKPRGTGGRVDPLAVTEQILYEIGDPGCYLLPDVRCDWRHVTVTTESEDRVRVTGARGYAPTGYAKVTTTVADGYRLQTMAAFAGGDAVGRARRTGDAILSRAASRLQRLGLPPFEEVCIEVVGGGDLLGHGDVGPGREAVLRVAARHQDEAALDALAREVAPLALVAQGMTGLSSGRARPSPVVRLVHLLVPLHDLSVSVHRDDGCDSCDVTPPAISEPQATTPLEDSGAGPASDSVLVPLRRVAVARSGDKGNHANVGVIARCPEVFDTIGGELSTAHIERVFGERAQHGVVRWDLPGLSAVNIMLCDALGGGGGTSSLRLDPQGKTYAAVLLDSDIAISRELLEASGL